MVGKGILPEKKGSIKSRQFFVALCTRLVKMFLYAYLFIFPKLKPANLSPSLCTRRRRVKVTPTSLSALESLSSVVTTLPVMIVDAQGLETFSFFFSISLRPISLGKKRNPSEQATIYTVVWCSFFLLHSAKMETEKEDVF